MQISQMVFEQQRLMHLMYTAHLLYAVNKTPRGIHTNRPAAAVLQLLDAARHFPMYDQTVA